MVFMTFDLLRHDPTYIYVRVYVVNVIGER